MTADTDRIRQSFNAPPSVEHNPSRFFKPRRVNIFGETAESFSSANVQEIFL